VAAGLEQEQPIRRNRLGIDADGDLAHPLLADPQARGAKEERHDARTPGMSASFGIRSMSNRPPPRAETSSDGTPSTVSVSRR
jgi:hypothetical protein